MKLTRRQTFLGLLGASSAAGLGAYELIDVPRSSRSTVSRDELETLLTVADVVFPADPRPLEPVIASYVDRLGDGRTRALVATVAELDQAAYAQFGIPVRSLSRGECERLFEVLGVTRVQPRPEGTVPERIRFHLVNAVLYSILTHPEGTGPFGITNPVGHPGGFSSFSEES